jgi:hypothetical protein
VGKTTVSLLAASNESGAVRTGKVSFFLGSELKYEFTVSQKEQLPYLEATPAESTAYRLAKHDKKRYPDIITASESNPGATPYYTNSSHLPVGYTEYCGEPEETGHIFIITWSTVHQDYKNYPRLLEGFIPAVESPDSPFMAEYCAMKKLAKELEEKVADKPTTKDFFDLME